MTAGKLSWRGKKLFRATSSSFRPGAIIPADCCLLEARDLFVNEAALTGETFPAEKSPVYHLRRNCAGTAQQRGLHGHARGQRQRTGLRHPHRAGRAEFGKVYESLRLRPPETEFEHGIRRFGYLLAEVTFLLVLAILPSTFTSKSRSSIRCSSRSRSPSD